MKRNLQAGRHRHDGLGLQMLTDDELEDIHLGTLEVLERTGVFVQDEEATEIFAGAGCRVDRSRRVVTIPAHIVEDAIASAPASVLLAGREEGRDVVLDSNRVGFTTFGTGLEVVDAQSGLRRISTKKDVGDSAKLADALSDIDVYQIAISARDAPPRTASIHDYEAALLNTAKCVGVGTLSAFDTQWVLDMAAAAVGGSAMLRERPILFFGVCPVSPLMLTKEVCEVIIAAARAGLPDNILSMAMSGGSAPVNLAGTLVAHNAEVLSGITLAQLVRRGSPVMYGSSTTAMDLRLGTAAVGSPECAMISAGAACLARRYRLPSYVAGL